MERKKEKKGLDQRKTNVRTRGFGGDKGREHIMVPDTCRVPEEVYAA